MTTLREYCTNLRFVHTDKDGNEVDDNEFSELLDTELTPDQLAHCQTAGELGRKGAEEFKKMFMREGSHYGRS